MDKFIYKNTLGITALKANINKFSYKKHSHEEYAIGVTLDGIQKYQLKGISQASHKNEVIFINPDEIHDGIDSQYDYVMLYIKPELFLEGLEKKDIVKLSPSIMKNEKLRYDILNLCSVILTQKDESLCNELYLNLIDNFSSKDFVLDYKKENILIQRAKDMIYYELNDILNLDKISKELNLSKFQFIRMFKANTGITPYQYFLNTKLIHAKKHLEKNKDIYDTLVKFSYSDLSHFNRHFKRVYGVTAYEYISN